MLEIIASGLLGAILGGIVGSLITYYTQKHTQERAWKREYAIKSIETVHGPMFVGMNNVLSELQKSPCYQVGFFEWSEIQNSYQYLMIDEEFKKRVENFFTKLEKYNEAILTARREVMDRIILEEAQHRFSSYRLDRLPQFLVKISQSQSEYANLIDCLFLQKHPVEYIAEMFPHLKNPEYYISLYRGGKVIDLHYKDSSKRKIDKMWKSCQERAEKDLTIQLIRREHDELLVKTQELIKELIKHIQEPWKI